MSVKKGSASLNRLRDLYSYAIDNLKPYYIEDINLKAELLLRHLLSLNKTQFYIKLSENAYIDKFNFIDFFYKLRLISLGYPVEYITNKKEFYGYELFVNEEVLVPRFDSELLVEKVIDFLSNLKKDDIYILDLGVGSANLIIPILDKLKKVKAIGVDISLKALDVAYKNLVRFNLIDRVRLLKSDMFLNVEGRFDVIISNPPYIKTKDLYKMKFEPYLALDGGKDGLKYYRIIKNEFKRYLKQDGCLFLEIGYDILDGVLEIFKDYNVESFKDFHSIYRVLKIC